MHDPRNWYLGQPGKLVLSANSGRPLEAIYKSQADLGAKRNPVPFEQVTKLAMLELASCWAEVKPHLRSKAFSDKFRLYGGVIIKEEHPTIYKVTYCD